MSSRSVPVLRPTDQVLTAAQVRAAEQALIDHGVSVDELMQRAGCGAAEWVWRLSGGRSVTVLCGPGNNGGDGYVIAEALRTRGTEVAVVVAADPATDAAKTARRLYLGEVLGSEAERHGEVLVDCLFGTGLTRPLSDAHLELLQKLSHAHHHRVAIDLPSGVGSDDGTKLNRILPSYDLTLALGTWKPAHWLMPAMDMMGERRLVEIGIDRVGHAPRILNRPILHVPPTDAHKYSRGLVGVISGAMRGAAILATRAAMRSGAGYVKLHREFGGETDWPELVVEGGELFDFLTDKRFSALAIGPGLGRDHRAIAALDEVLSRELPSVIDGDALRLIDPGKLAARREGLVLTPHGGELDHLYEAWSIAPGDRVERLEALARATRSVVVAKGPDTLIASHDGTLIFSASAHAPSWLSVAGSGDVLAGIVAARLASGVTDLAAAEQAVWLHARAGQLAGPLCLPSDLIAALPHAFAECL